MTKIAIAGFQHETNSFGITKAGLAEFEMADSWPAMLRGADVIDHTQGMNLPLAGFAAAAKDKATLHPILWCSAEPSGLATTEAFDKIAGDILTGIRTAGEIDAVYLDLHGAMITEAHLDGEGALLRLIRNAVGPELPIAISLDLHANLTQAMVDACDVICLFKNYPHLDMAETGARAWDQLQHTLLHGRRAKAFRQADFLIPTHAQHTGPGPARQLYAALPDRPGHHVELALGFTAGDTPDTGPALVAYAETQSEAEALADLHAAELAEAEDAFELPLLTPEAAATQATNHRGDKPLILADVQDNPGAGASSDTVGLLRALIAVGARGVIMGLMHDPALVEQAIAAGEGAEFTGDMGGRSGVGQEAPLNAAFTVDRIGDGQCRYSGEMYGGGVATLGPTAVLGINDQGADIQVVVTSIRNQCLDLAHFTHLGLDPKAAQVICVKSTAHFRADFEPIASHVLTVAAPGLFPCELSHAQFKHLRPGVRIAGAVAPEVTTK